MNAWIIVCAEYIPVVIHMAIDQIDDQSELSRMQNPRFSQGLPEDPPPTHSVALEEVVAQLEELCHEAVSGQSWTNPLYLSWDNEKNR